MKSLFPGMDLYLETHWEDVYRRFLVDAVSLKQRMSVLPVPLRRPEASATLDLHALVSSDHKRICLFEMAAVLLSCGWT